MFPLRRGVSVAIGSMGWGGVYVNGHNGYRLYATGQLRTPAGREGRVVPGVPPVMEAGTTGTFGKCGN